MEAKHTPQILKLAENRTITADTNAEFLNEVVGTNYIQWYKSGYTLSSNTIIWMPRIDGKIRKGWRNIWLDENTILEEFLGGDYRLDPVVKHPYRIVAEIQESYFGRNYVIKGMFKYAKEESTSTKHLWKRDI